MHRGARRALHNWRQLIRATLRLQEVMPVTEHEAQLRTVERRLAFCMAMNFSALVPPPSDVWRRVCDMLVVLKGYLHVSDISRHPMLGVYERGDDDENGHGVWRQLRRADGATPTVDQGWLFSASYHRRHATVAEQKWIIDTAERRAELRAGESSKGVKFATQEPHKGRAPTAAEEWYVTGGSSPFFRLVQTFELRVQTKDTPADDREGEQEGSRPSKRQR